MGIADDSANRFDDENHLYVNVKKIYLKGHTYLKITNTWSSKGDITFHDPNCACGNGNRLMQRDLLEYDLLIPIPHRRVNVVCK